MYKITKNLSPAYLISLVPATVQSNSSYPLRNGANIRNVTARTTSYSNSFVPSAITEWNNLPLETRNADSLHSFKMLLSSDTVKSNSLYYYGERRQQMLHTRLRTRCSSLNQDLYMCNIVQSPLCSCGSIETVYHYFLECDRFRQQREVLINTIAPLAPTSLNTLLYGDESIDFEKNTRIFDAVHEYIKQSKRFDT